MIQTEQQHRVRRPDPYLENFRELEANGLGNTPGWVFPLRKSAISRFAEMGFPTPEDEDWRYTNVGPIAKLPFRPVLETTPADIGKPSIESVTFGRIEAHRLVFVDGCFSEALSSAPSLPQGAIVQSLAAALRENTTILEKHLTRYASDEKNSFAALNTAFFQDGAFVYLPAGCELTRPIHLVFVSTGDDAGTAAHPRNLVLMERGSRATMLESFSALGDAAYVTNAVTELALEDDAELEHCKFQDESAAAFHIATFHAQLGRRSRLTAHSIALGAKLSRNNIRTVLNGEGIECVLNGLYLTKDDQLADHHMIVEHAQRHCNSHEYFNGILEDRSRGVFHGRILVRPEAQKTDAKQTNKNLLLSDTATIDTKPQLEIYADDVKCTHGATVGQLNEESIFYLRARGIGTDTARRMLIHAFAGEIIDRVRHQPARAELDTLVWDRLEQNPQVAEVH